jgi:hypothetical protein
LENREGTSMGGRFQERLKEFLAAILSRQDYLVSVYKVREHAETKLANVRRKCEQLTRSAGYILL